MKDILLDDNGDIAIKNGDLVIVESKKQEAELILKSNQGDWKNEPLVGANLSELINSDTPEYEIKSLIKRALAFDSKALRKFEGGNAIIEA